MRFNPRIQEVCHPVMLAFRDDQRILEKNVDVVLDNPVFKIQLVRKLIEVAGTVLQLVNDACPVLTASRAPKQVPKEAAQLRIVRHCPQTTQFGIYPLKLLYEVEEILKKT